jgi:hypothetical protein
MFRNSGGVGRTPSGTMFRNSGGAGRRGIPDGGTVTYHPWQMNGTLGLPHLIHYVLNLVPYPAWRKYATLVDRCASLYLSTGAPISLWRAAPSPGAQVPQWRRLGCRPPARQHEKRFSSIYMPAYQPALAVVRLALPDGRRVLWPPPAEDGGGSASATR